MGERLDELVALTRGQAAVEEADLAAEAPVQVRHEPVEAGVLREDERLVVGRHRLEQLDQALELAGAARERPAGREHHLRVVAHLLQLAQHREHGAAPAEAALVLLDPRHPAVDGRLVEARLLEGELAVLLRDRDLRQLELDLGAVLRPPQDERLHHRPEPLERPRVAVRLDRACEAALEPLARAEQAGVDDVHDRPELVEPVLDRRARHRERAARVEPAQRPRPLGGGVLDVLRLVEQQPVPADQRERLDVAGGDVVRGDHDIARAGDLHELGAGQALAAVVQVDAQRRARTARSPAPTAA